FQALHFSWYNRHCTKGYDAPSGAQPLTLRRTNGSKTNYHQLIPYPSKDMTDPRGKQSIYQSVKNILAPVFEFLDSKLQELLPETYERLDAYARILPGNEQPVGAPFLGLVVNVNVVTAAHRDSKDEGVCLVLVVGDFLGGELVLYEPGLVLPLLNGDFTIFPSCELTHFNLHY
ncbi:hypothetical protein FOMPIDRAFT_1082463, partial [Fomitopsis schrenkii]